MDKNDVEIPEPPKFLRRKSGTGVVHIKQLTDKDLQAIGEQWTRQLLAEAYRWRVKKSSEEVR